MKPYIAIFSLGLLWACNSGDKKTGESTTSTESVKSEHSDAFNSSFERVLNSYYLLKDGLFASDTVKVNRSTLALISAVDSLNMDELKTSDSNNVIIPTARSYTGTISSEGKGLLGEKDIEAKRKEFQMISGALFDLIRTVRYDRQKIYLLNCPMAFDNQGADWLSSTPDIQNPYLGAKMPNCGNLKDSIVLK